MYAGVGQQRQRQLIAVMAAPRARESSALSPARACCPDFWLPPAVTTATALLSSWGLPARMRSSPAGPGTGCVDLPWAKRARALIACARPVSDEVVMAGAVKRPSFGDLRPDMKTVAFFARIAGQSFLGDDGLCVQ